MGQPRTDRYLPNGTSDVKRKRRPPQRGVQAVFTANKDRKGTAQLVVGLASILGGVLAWTYTTRAQGGFGLGDAVPWDPTANAILLPFSIPLLVIGVGLCTYYFAIKRTWRASNRIESALFELETLVGQKNGLEEPSRELSRSSGISWSSLARKKFRVLLGSGTFVFALVEAVILLVIYSGLVQEYTSNMNMQNWVRANFAPGAYLLSYNAVFAVAGILAFLIFQLLPRRIRSKLALK